jgi:hypothetical protein
MVRHAAAAAVVLCICPAWLFAQSTQVVVKTASANVHRAPTTASPVIDTAPRGAVLEVTSDLGSWVKVSWPDAPGGVAYVHESTITTARTPLARRGGTAGSASAPQTPSDSGAAGARTYRREIASVARHGSIDSAGNAEAMEPAGNGGYATASDLYIRPPAHIVGFGGRMTGSTLGYGVSARAWPHRHLGFQVDMSRYTLTSPGAPARLTSMVFAPSALYRFADRVNEYVWVRPYIGGGATLHRQNLGPGFTDTTLGYQAFGGGELTFASMPRFAIGVDAGHRWSQEPSNGLDLGGVTFSISGHWYFK